MVEIAKPARSVYETAPDNLKTFLERLAEQVGRGPNWMVRKKTLGELLLALQAYFTMPPEQRKELREATGAPPEEDDEQDNDPTKFGEVLPIYVAAVLERLNEERIASAEQAAVYFLSVYPEHRDAAEAWMTASLKNSKAVRKLIDKDKYLAPLYDIAEDALPKEG